MVDPAQGRIHRYSPTAEYRGAIMRPGRGPLDFGHPTHIEALEGGGYLLNDSGDRFLRLDSEFHPESSFHFRHDEVRGFDGRLFPVRWAVFRNQLVAFAHLQSQDGKPDQGYVVLDLGSRLSWASRSEATSLQQLWREDELEESTGDLYTLLNSSIAATTRGWFVLRLVEPPYILQLGPEKKRLVAFPSGFGKLPRLPENRGPSTTALRNKALERATVPVALLARGDNLYLLTREPREEGGTRWKVSSIDPVADRITHTVELPTTAPHLTVAPGPEHWALVEKDTPVRAGRQDIGPMLLVPSRWIEDPEVRKLQGPELPTCR